VRLLDGRIADDVAVRAAVDVDATLRRLRRTAPG
jgi:hypothetical protein